MTGLGVCWEDGWLTGELDGTSGKMDGEMDERGLDKGLSGLRGGGRDGQERPTGWGPGKELAWSMKPRPLSLPVLSWHCEVGPEEMPMQIKG